MASLAHCLPVLLLFLQGVSWCHGTYVPQCPKRCTDPMRRGDCLSGHINSFFYPKNYPNNAHCIQSFKQPYQMIFNMVEINFTTFKTEFSYGCNKDYLAIGKFSYCGEQLQGKTILRPLPLEFEFVSDAETTFQGFNASFRLLIVDCPLNVTSNLTGYITSPNYPSYYPKNYACRFKFPDSPFGDFKSMVQLKFSAFDLEYDSSNCSRDSLAMHNVKYCGRQLDQKTVNVDYQRRPSVTFESDFMTEQSGFYATYEFKVKECDVHLITNDTRYFQTPRYPDKYPTPYYCYYRIPQQMNATFSNIEITFTEFNITEKRYSFQPCYQNSLRIDDKDFCGHSLQGKSVITSVPANLLFQDYKKGYYGSSKFYANFRYIGNACELNAVGNETSGYFESFGFPQNYSLNYNCTYTIPKTAESGSFVTLFFLEFQLEPAEFKACVNDYLKINENKYCGTDLKGRTVNTTLPAVIQFRSNEKINYQGFNATYSYQNNTQ